jgi:hypothetical protein
MEHILRPKIKNTSPITPGKARMVPLTKVANRKMLHPRRKRKEVEED